MTKSDLLVNSDGSLEVLIPETEVKRSKPAQRNVALRRILIQIFLFGLIVGTAVVTYVYFAHLRHHTWKRKIDFFIVKDDKMMSDVVEYNPKEETITFGWCGTVTDLNYGLNAVILDNYWDIGSSVCAIYDRRGFERHLVIGNEHNDDMMEEFLEQLQNETHDAIVDEHFWEPKPEPIEDRSFLPKSIQRKCGDLPVYWMKQIDDRYKRQTTEEEEEQEQPQEVGAEEVDSPPYGSEALPPNLRVDSGESDHEKDCCQNCKRPYVYCYNVCVPIRRIEYPYYYRSCNSRACFSIFPCTYWYNRLSGQV